MPARGRNPDAAPARRFRRLLYGSTAVIALLMVTLIGANLAQGPHLTSAQINLGTSVERAGQRLLLQSNEPLAAVAADQVSITPAANATTTVTANSLDVQFTDVLRYNTSYTVNVRDVKSISAGASSTFSYSFTTPDPVMYFLATSAGEGTNDAIKSVPLSGGDAITVFSAPHIRQFVAFANLLVVNTINDDDTDALTIVSLTGGTAIPVQLAGAGTVTSLQASPGSNLFGYTFSPAPSPQYQTPPDQLFAYDLTRGQDYAIPITGADHEQLSARDWMFVPGTTSLVALAAGSAQPGSALQLIDTLGEREGTSGAVVVGAAQTLNGFVPGTKRLVTTQAGVSTATDLGTTPPASTPFALSSSSPLAGHPLGGMCLAPNGRYAAVTSAPSHISFVDLADGTTVSTVNGSQPNWCSNG
jgi:hypothetical protein